MNAPRFEVLVVIEVRCGVACVTCKPQGVRLLIRDYDVQEETGKQDSHGCWYSEQEYEPKTEV